MLVSKYYHLYIFKEETKIPDEKHADAYSYNNGTAVF